MFLVCLICKEGCSITGILKYSGEYSDCLIECFKPKVTCLKNE